MDSLRRTPYQGSASAARAGKALLRKSNYWRHHMATGWTTERKARQAELIRIWRPWDRSTGPRTHEGKAITSMNAYKGGHLEGLSQLSILVREQIRAARELVASVAQSR